MLVVEFGLEAALRMGLGHFPNLLLGICLNPGDLEKYKFNFDLNIGFSNQFKLKGIIK